MPSVQATWRKHYLVRWLFDGAETEPGTDIQQVREVFGQFIGAWTAFTMGVGMLLASLLGLPDSIPLPPDVELPRWAILVVLSSYGLTIGALGLWRAAVLSRQLDTLFTANDPAGESPARAEEKRGYEHVDDTPNPVSPEGQSDASKRR